MSGVRPCHRLVGNRRGSTSTMNSDVTTVKVDQSLSHSPCCLCFSYVTMGVQRDFNHSAESRLCHRVTYVRGPLPQSRQPLVKPALAPLRFGAVADLGVARKGERLKKYPVDVRF